MAMASGADHAERLHVRRSSRAVRGSVARAILDRVRSVRASSASWLTRSCRSLILVSATATAEVLGLVMVCVVVLMTQ